MNVDHLGNCLKCGKPAGTSGTCACSAGVPVACPDAAREACTLRDRFAMAALQSIIACGEYEGDELRESNVAYKYADAMLRAREETVKAGTEGDR